MDYRYIYLKLLNLKNRIEQFEKTLLGKHGLTRNDTLIISALGVSDLTLSELGKTCCIDKSTITKIVKKLTASGYVEKGIERRRGNFVTLTEKGRQHNQLTIAAFEELSRSAQEFLSEEEFSSVNSILDKLLKISDESHYKGILQNLNKVKDNGVN